MRALGALRVSVRKLKVKSRTCLLSILELTVREMNSADRWMTNYG